MDIKRAVVTFGLGWGIFVLSGILTGIYWSILNVTGLIAMSVAFTIWFFDGSCGQS